jgi:hypothetical protein
VSTVPPDASQHLTSWLGPNWSARPLAGDASVRAYYRVTASDGTSYILAYYPEEVRPQLARFLGAYDAVSPHVRAPEVLHHSEVCVLQHDAGERTLFDVLHQDREEGVRLYHEAIELLVQFQRAECAINPPFTAASFLAELEMAVEFYVEKLMSGSREPLVPAMKTIAENVARHPYVQCHRDFHGQNLHIVNDDLFLIDYQDLRMGPDTYDLASLIRDRGVGLIIGDATEHELIEYYRTLRSADAGIRHRYFETLLQRSIKILGTFSKQPIVRGKLHYLDFIPGTLASIERCLGELPEYAALRDTFPMSFDPGAARERARELNTE